MKTLLLIIPFFISFNLFASMKIISTSPALTEMVSLFDSKAKLVAVSDYCSYPERACRLPRVGTSFGLNLEKIIKLKPDVIFFQSLKNSRQSRDLQNLKIKTMSFQLNQLEDIFDTMVRMGELFGQNDLAKNYNDKIKKALKTQGLRQRVALAVGFKVKDDLVTGMTLVGKDNYMGDILKEMSIFNVGKNFKGYVDLSIEKVIPLKPQIIVLLTSKKEEALYKKSFVKIKEKGFFKDTKLIVLTGQENFVPSHRILNFIENLKTSLLSEGKSK